MIATVIWKEILHRPTRFITGAISAAVAVIAPMMAVVLLESFDHETERLLDEKKKNLEQNVIKDNDDYRKISLITEHNLFILPSDEDLFKLYETDSIAGSMPETLAQDLIESPVSQFIKHILADRKSVV